MFDEVISSVQLDLHSQRLNANNRMKPMLAQLEQLEKIAPGDYTSETRNKIENLERGLAEVRRCQVEIVELSFKNMYELGHMVTREREELLLINQSKGKLEEYERVIKAMEGGRGPQGGNF